jgi:hypothetical protein
MMFSTKWYSLLSEAVKEVNSTVSYGEIASFQVISELNNQEMIYCIVVVLAK